MGEPIQSHNGTIQGEGYRCVTIVSTYISDVMVHIGQFEWGINSMIGTAAQVNHTGADAKATIDKMEN